MHLLQQRSPKQLVAQFLDPALPLNIIRSSPYAINNLILLCNVDYNNIEFIKNGIRTIANQELEKLFKVIKKSKNFKTVLSKQKKIADLKLATPLAIASYFINGAFVNEEINGNPMITQDDIPSLLEAIVKMTKPIVEIFSPTTDILNPEGRLPVRYKGDGAETILADRAYHLKLPRQFSILEDIEATHMLRLLCISQQDAKSKMTLFNKFKDSYSGPITNYAARLIYPMIEEVQKRIERQMKNEKNQKPGQHQAFDLANARLGIDLPMISIKNMPQA